MQEQLVGLPPARYNSPRISRTKERPLPSQRESVLVVEDDREINSLVGAYVELCGFTYRSALNGKRALEEVNAELPALVVLDLMLPDLDGFEVCTQIKAAAATRDVCVIMLTALSGDADRQRGRDCGAADYLTKPFDPDALMSSIARHAKRQNKAEG
jgi:DNA-binding response OmpR family regulator